MIPHIEREIRAQAQAWRSALDAVRAQHETVSSMLERARGREVRFLGSGSSYYLGMATAPTWGRRGWNTRVLPSAEQVLHGDAYPSSGPPLAIAVSRSGATTETLRALELLKKSGSPTIGITTQEGTPMDDLCDIVLHMVGAHEQSTVQTRSFSAQFLAAQALAGLGAGGVEELRPLEMLPSLADELIETADAHVTPLAPRFQRVFVLGTGMRWGLAMEGALKLKETSLTESEAFHTLEFRHGPKSMIDGDTLVVGLVGERTRVVELAVLHEMRALGAKVVAVGANLEAEELLNPLSFPGSLPEDDQGVLYLPPLQLLSYRRGVGKGLDPDHPRNLTFAVELEGI